MNAIIMVRFCWATLVALFGFAVSASVSEAAATLEANKRLVLRYYDAALNGRYEEIDQIFADNYVRHNQSEWVSKAPPQSEIARAIHRHMPDQRATFEVILAEDDLVAVRWRLQGNPGDLPIKILRMAIGPRGPVTHTGIKSSGLETAGSLRTGTTETTWRFGPNSDFSDGTASGVSLRVRSWRFLLAN